jgi:DNA-directed RNA polymerase subunit E'/Rpb7
MGDEKESPFYKADITLKAALFPTSAPMPMEAVKKQLNDLLFKYNDELNGVPMAYSELSIPKGKEYARIIGETFWLHVDVNTKLLVFKPEAGAVLKGTVVKVCDRQDKIRIAQAIDNEMVFQLSYRFQVATYHYLSTECSTHQYQALKWRRRTSITTNQIYGTCDT